MRPRTRIDGGQPLCTTLYDGCVVLTPRAPGTSETRHAARHRRRVRRAMETHGITHLPYARDHKRLSVPIGAPDDPFLALLPATAADVALRLGMSSTDQARKALRRRVAAGFAVSEVPTSSSHAALFRRSQ